MQHRATGKQVRPSQVKPSKPECRRSAENCCCCIAWDARGIRRWHMAKCLLFLTKSVYIYVCATVRRHAAVIYTKEWTWSVAWVRVPMICAYMRVCVYLCACAHTHSDIHTNRYTMPAIKIMFSWTKLQNDWFCPSPNAFMRMYACVCMCVCVYIFMLWKFHNCSKLHATCQHAMYMARTSTHTHIQLEL